MKKIICVLLSMILSGFVFAAGTGESKTPSMEKAAKLTFYMHSRNLKEGSFVWNTVEEQNDVELEIIQASTKELENKLTLMLASGDYPDIINWYNDSMEAKLVSAGLLLPLNEYWDQFPEIRNARNDDIWNIMKSADGNIYSIGWNMEGQGSNGLAYRKDWLDKFGLEIPRTLDEYYEVARQIAYNDPDGNGANDTYAMGGYQDVTGKTVGSGNWWDHIWGAFGALPNHWIEKNGKIINGSVVPEMVDALKFLNRMYSDGLIDPEFVTDNSKRWKTKVKAGVFGAGVTKLQIFDRNNQNNYYIPFKEKNPDGQFVYGPMLQGGSDNPLGVRKVSAKGWLRTGIWKSSPNVDAALRVLNWVCSKENNRFLNYGVEGEHYSLDEVGMVEKLVNNQEANELGLTQFYMAYSNLLEHTSSEYREAGAYFNSTAAPDVMDGIYVDEMTTTYEKLKDLTNQAFIAMIVGNQPIETGFQEFVSEWNGSGGLELTEAVNSAYTSR